MTTNPSSPLSFLRQFVGCTASAIWLDAEDGDPSHTDNAMLVMADAPRDLAMTMEGRLVLNVESRRSDARYVVYEKWLAHPLHAVVDAIHVAVAEDVRPIELPGAVRVPSTFFAIKIDFASKQTFYFGPGIHLGRWALYGVGENTVETRDLESSRARFDWQRVP